MKNGLIIAVALATLGLGCVFTVMLEPSAWAQSAATTIAAVQQTATFTIENMTCALCPVTVRKAMQGVTGVTAVEIDFDAKTATVTFDPAVATLEKIAFASTNVGYPAKVVQQGS